MANKIIFDKTVTPQMSSLSAPSSKGSSDYGVGNSGQVLTSDGENIYWGNAAEGSSTSFGTVGSQNTPIYFSEGVPKEIGRMSFCNATILNSTEEVTIELSSSGVYLITVSGYNTNSAALFLVTVTSSGYPFVSVIHSVSNITCKYLNTNQITLTNNTSQTKRVMCLGSSNVSFSKVAG